MQNDISVTAQNNPTIGVHGRLQNLEKYFPDQEKIMYEFGEYLSRTIRDGINPAGFFAKAHMAIYDLQKGVNAFTNEAITGSIAGYPKIMYPLLAMSIPDIARAVFSETHAQEVDAVIKGIQEKTLAANPPK